MATALVFMGVSGCGKSSVGEAVARALDLSLIEGDDFHPAANKAKMTSGVPLTDADRHGWLEALGAQLAAHRDGVLITCSALKRKYREQLRGHRPDVRFVFLDLDRESAFARVKSRGATHFFSPTLVDNQFATLEPPDRESGVLKVDATRPLTDLVTQVVEWDRNLGN